MQRQPDSFGSPKLSFTRTTTRSPPSCESCRTPSCSSGTLVNSAVARSTSMMRQTSPSYSRLAFSTQRARAFVSVAMYVPPTRVTTARSSSWNASRTLFARLRRSSTDLHDSGCCGVSARFDASNAHNSSISPQRGSLAYLSQASSYASASPRCASASRVRSASRSRSSVLRSSSRFVSSACIVGRSAATPKHSKAQSASSGTTGASGLGSRSPRTSALWI